MKEPYVNLKKLDNMSRAVIHIGKEPGIKAYILFNPDTRRIYVSHDIIFEEKKSWNLCKIDDTHTMQPGNFSLVTNHLEGNVNGNVGEETSGFEEANDVDESADTDNVLSPSMSHSSLVTEEDSKGTSSHSESNTSAKNSSSEDE